MSNIKHYLSRSCLCGLLLAASLNSYSQITLNARGASVKSLIHQIETQSDYRFFFEDELSGLSKKVNINAKDQSITQVMDAICSQAGIGYTIKGDNQVIVHAPKSVTVSAQQSASKRIKGVVNDPTGTPVIGANIRVKGTTVGTITDIDGNFVLEVDGNAELLEVSYIGYKTQDIPLKGKKEFTIVLKEDTETLDEVVVVGFGTQKKASLTGAVATVTGEDLVKRPVYNVASSLQGKLPGLSISQASGQPGSEGISMRIRGMGTFSDAGSDPLVIIDGISGDINSINSSDIESITVLKDAASAAIYGARAANGVILVTTKSGKKGKMSITYDINYAVHNPTRMLKLITNSADYMELKNEALKNSGLSSNRMYPQEIIDLYRNATDRVKYPNYDWIDLMFNPALAYSHNLNVNGGGEKTSYNTSLGYSNQDGVMRGFNNQRVNFSINTKTDINKHISFGTKANMYYYDREAPVIGSTDLFLSTMAQAPTYGPTLPDGRYVYRAYDFEDNNKNPYANAKEAIGNTKGFDISAQAWLDVKFTDYLTWHTKGAVTGTFDKAKSFRPLIPQYNWHTEEFSNNLNVGGTQKSLTVKDENDILTTLYSHLTFDKKFGDHALKVMAGYNQETYKYEYLEGYRQGFAGNNLHEINAGGTNGQTTGGSANEWAIQSFFGRLNYDYQGKYMLEANVRYDGTSRLYKDSRWGAFPSVSAAWRISEEKFMKSLDFINNLKFRLSYGELGNQNIGNYPYQELLKLDYNYVFDNQTVSSGVAPERLANQAILWERTSSWDFGVDMSVLNNKLSFVFDWYRKKTSDILRGSQIPSNIGLDAPTVNDGEVTNTGIELTITHQNQLENGLYYSISGMINKNKNELTSFGEDEIGTYSIKREGQPWNTFYLYQWDGIFQNEEEVANHAEQPYNPQPGDLKYKDVSGPDGVPDGKIDSNDKVLVNGRFPKFEYSFNLNLEYKNFYVSAFFQGVQGIKFYVGGWGFEPFCQGAAPTEDWLTERWTPENPTNEKPRIYIGRETPAMSNMPSTYFLQNGSYFRLKNLQVGYTFKQKWLQTVKVNSLRLYFSGDNLFTITSYPYLDPERSSDDGSFALYPQNKVFSLGASINF